MTFNKKYIDFYHKSFRSLRLPYKFTNDNQLMFAISNSAKIPSSLACNLLCVYNPFSLSNVIRRTECNRMYLTESEKVTAPTNKLKAELFRLHKSLTSKSREISSNIAQAQELSTAEYPNSDKSVYGLVVFTFLLDVKFHTMEYYMNMLSRKADLLNYNYIDHQVTDASPNNTANSLQWLQIEFEATYQDKVRLDLSDYVYHVTTKNAADKIIKHGLLPCNKNSNGFHYNDRVYVFTKTAMQASVPKAYIGSVKKPNKKFLTYAECEKLVKSYIELERKENGIVVDSREFTILQIDMCKLSNVKFYRDNTFELNGMFMAAFTEQPIKPNAISRLEDFTLKGEVNSN